ncbi:hypothetical protein VIMS_02431 [Mycobacterium marinum]|uniref:DUF2746 domain-containing protein n=1 Tax=Mycobacterium marinum TaxID=1781 RepID=UPI000E3DFF7B|nr:DUF2746 domain-containing protein [Mycobacterium marinum]RFZ15001.1 hypothetical protein VIMS_02431 [Mycobacterium marinum]
MLAGAAPVLEKVSDGESWYAVAISAIVTFGGLLGMYIKQRAEISHVRSGVKKIDDQVSNQHGDKNLRDQLDGMQDMLIEQSKDIRGVRGGLDTLTGDVSELRKEVHSGLDVAHNERQDLGTRLRRLEGGA